MTWTNCLRIAPNSARALRERAWILATCPNAKIRDGEQAVLSASKACELTGWNEPHTLAILAAACSEAADFEGAVKWQQKALDLLPEKSPDKREYRGLLDRYKAKKPYHRLGLLEELGLPDPPSGSEVRRTGSGQHPTNVHAERNPFMSPILNRPIIALAIVVGMCASAGASDLPGGTSLQPFVRPKKSSSTQDRSFEYMQKSPDFSLNDGSSKTIPNGVGYICLLERSQGDQLLVAIRSQGLRGWAPASSLVPLNHAETFFSQQILANPRDPFAFLMRGMARFENDDLDRAFADVDEAIRLQPTYVPALVERAYLWQCRNRLDLALADANQAIKLDSQNSYAYVERGVFHFAHERVWQGAARF